MQEINLLDGHVQGHVTKSDHVCLAFMDTQDEVQATGWHSGHGATFDFTNHTLGGGQTISLSAPQMMLLFAAWNALYSSEPLERTFHVERRKGPGDGGADAAGPSLQDPGKGPDEPDGGE